MDDMVEVRDEFYRMPEGQVRQRRLIAGREVWNSIGPGFFCNTSWPWDWFGQKWREGLHDHLDRMASPEATKAYKAMPDCPDLWGKYLWTPETALVKEGPKAIVKYGQ